MAFKYGLFRGCGWMGSRTANGGFGPGKEYHATQIEVVPSNAEVEHWNTCGALRVKDFVMDAEKALTLNVTIDSFSHEALAMALGGAITDKSTAETFTGLLFPNPVAIGEVTPIPGGFTNLESATITDSTGSPVTLTAGTHYTIDLKSGLVTWLDVTSSSVTQPFKAAGTGASADYNVISVNDVASVERWLRLDGINAADSNKPFIADFWRCKIRPASVQLKQAENELWTMSFEMEVLADPQVPFSEAYGQFGRVVATK